MPSHLSPLSGTLAVSRDNLGETGGRKRGKGGAKKEKQTLKTNKGTMGEEEKNPEGKKKVKGAEEIGGEKQRREEAKGDRQAKRRKLHPKSPHKDKDMNTPAKNR